MPSIPTRNGGGVLLAVPANYPQSCPAGATCASSASARAVCRASMAETTARANAAAMIDATSPTIAAAVAAWRLSGEFTDHSMRTDMLVITLEMIHIAHQEPMSAEFADASIRMFLPATASG